MSCHVVIGHQPPTDSIQISILKHIVWSNLYNLLTCRWLQEYEKSQMDNVDWSSMEQDNNVICPVCQRTNFSLNNSIVSCSHCKCNIKTNKSLLDIKKSVNSCIDRHNTTCNSDIQFVLVPEVMLNEDHIYLICESCMEMQLIVWFATESEAWQWHCHLIFCISALDLATS